MKCDVYSTCFLESLFFLRQRMARGWVKECWLKSQVVFYDVDNNVCWFFIILKYLLRSQQKEIGSLRNWNCFITVPTTTTTMKLTWEKRFEFVKMKKKIKSEFWVKILSYSEKSQNNPLISLCYVCTTRLMGEYKGTING